MRGRWSRYHRTGLAIPLTAAAVATPIQLLVGNWAARELAANQPIKLAAMEGLGETTQGASLHLLGWYTNGHVDYGIEIPRLLSLLAYHNPNAVVEGLNTVSVADQPPINVVRYAFQTMVGIGSILAGFGGAFLFFLW